MREHEMTNPTKEQVPRGDEAPIEHLDTHRGAEEEVPSTSEDTDASVDGRRRHHWRAALWTIAACAVVAMGLQCPSSRGKTDRRPLSLRRSRLRCR